MKSTWDRTSPNPFSVRPGQVWENLDPRNKNTIFQVLSVREDQGYAITQKPGGSLGKVKLVRFRPMTNGYKLVRDV